MPLTPDELNLICNNEVARFTYLSLHTGDPSTTGTNEVASSNYARQPLNWGAANNGLADADQESFSCDAATFTHFGFWDSITAGNFLGSQELDAPSVLQDPGTVKVTAHFAVGTL